MTEHPHFVLWLLLDPPAAARVQALIDELATRHHTVRFAPHVTLLGSIEGEAAGLIESARLLAAELVPVDVRLATLDMCDEYFRALFAHVEPYAALKHAHVAAARRLRPAAMPGDYMPHVSLLYTNLTAGEKLRMATQLSRHFPIDARLAQLALLAIDGPDPKQWRELARFDMGR